MDLTLLAGRYNALSNDAYHAFRRSTESGEDPWTAAINAARVPDDEWSTDQIADRVPLPEPLLERLTLNLSVWPMH